MDAVMKTESLLIRPLSLEDADDLFAFAKDEETMRLTGRKPLKDRGEAEKMILSCLERFTPFGIVYEGHMIGYINVKKLKQTVFPEFGSMNCHELGYVLGRKYQGKGFMTQALLSVCEWCFRELSSDLILCSFYPENKGSKRVLEKCGFAFHRQVCFPMMDGSVVEETAMILKRPEKL